MNKRTAALILAVFVLFGGLQPVVLSEGTDSISTAEELIRFLNGCRSDEYSKGKSFTLVSDIDLQGETILAGAVFCGVFEGGGHTISNFYMEIDSGEGGFFGEISEGAWVNNLKLNGDINLKEDDKAGTDADTIISDIIKNTGATGVNPSEAVVYIGGIAGKNGGHIYGCSFDGSINGRKSVGGLVGKNEDTGVIDSSVNGAEVNGIEDVGGICGENNGIIRNSVNNGIINSEADAAAVNVGGIAGNSNGVIEACYNGGEVGCMGYGTNTGGIAGKQSGCIIGSNNDAAVSGKKNIGGIVGLFSPYTDIDANMDSLRDEIDSQKQELEDEFDEVKSDIENDIDDIKDSLDIFSLGRENSTNITEGRRNVLDSVASYIDSATESSEDKNKSREELIDSISGLLDNAKTVNDSLSSAMNGLDENLTKLTDNLTKLRDSSEETAESIRNMMDNLSDSVSESEESRTKLRNSISSAVDRIDLSTNALDDIADSIDGTLTVLNRTLRTLDSNSDDVTESITAPLNLLYRRLKTRAAEIDNRKKKLEEFKEKLLDLKDKIDNVINIGDNGWTIIPGEEDGEEIPDIYGGGTGEIIGAVEKTAGIFSKVMGFIFPTAHAADIKTLDEIFDTEAIKEEMKKVISVDVALDRNVAGEYFDNAVVESSCNLGDVSGSSAVGGIVGGMGIESLRTNGETITLPNGKPIISDMTMKAVVNSCVNDAEIYAKTEDCGGVVGYANMGIIKNCLGAGGAEAPKEAGGVGGDCVATVLYSIGAARVSGDEALGGIAGRGGNIHECYSISTFENENAKGIGGIAASVEGSIKNNYFIDEGIGGIGGTSYTDSAQPVAFASMISSDKLPEALGNFFNDDWYVESGDLYFPQIRALAEAQGINAEIISAKSAEYAKSHFNVTFVIDGETVKSLVKEYGEMLEDSEIPEIPKKNGTYPYWSRSTSEPIRRHTVFEAVYDEAVTTISSGENPPIILLEGLFSENSMVTVTEITCTDEFGGYKTGKAYSFTVTPEADGKDGFTARILDKGGKGVAIAILDEKTIIEGYKDGSYLVCEMSGPGEFVILEKGGISAPLAIVLTALAVLMIVGGALAVVFIRRKKKA